MVNEIDEPVRLQHFKLIESLYKFFILNCQCYWAKVARVGPIINDNGDCQVPIEFEASRLLQTDSEVLLSDSILHETRLIV